MKALVLVASAVAFCTALPAHAGIMVISGGSYAQGCFKAAEQNKATLEAIGTCNRAFSDEALSAEDELATYVNRGILHMLRSNYVGANTDFTAATAMDPKRAEPWLNMGILRFKQGNVSEARTLFSKAIELGTDMPEIAYYGRGLANEELGDVKSAYIDLRKAAELRPQWREPARELARYQVRPR